MCLEKERALYTVFEAFADSAYRLQSVGVVSRHSPQTISERSMRTQAPDVTWGEAKPIEFSKIQLETSFDTVEANLVSIVIGGLRDLGCCFPLMKVFPIINNIDISVVICGEGGDIYFSAAAYFFSSELIWLCLHTICRNEIRKEK